MTEIIMNTFEQKLADINFRELCGQVVIEAQPDRAAVRFLQGHDGFQEPPARLGRLDHVRGRVDRLGSRRCGLAVPPPVLDLAHVESPIPYDLVEEAPEPSSLVGRTAESLEGCMLHEIVRPVFVAQQASGKRTQVAFLVQETLEVERLVAVAHVSVQGCTRHGLTNRLNDPDIAWELPGSDHTPVRAAHLRRSGLAGTRPATIALHVVP